MLKKLFLMSLIFPFLCTAQDVDVAHLVPLQEAIKQTNLAKVQALVTSIKLTEEEKLFLFRCAQEVVSQRNNQAKKAESYLPGKELREGAFIGANCGVQVAANYFANVTWKARLVAGIGTSCLVCSFFMLLGWVVYYYESLLKDALKIQSLISPFGEITIDLRGIDHE